MDSRTLGHVVSTDENKNLELYAVSLREDAKEASGLVSTSELVGRFPTTGLANYKYSLEAGKLVFSAYAWDDVDCEKIGCFYILQYFLICFGN